MPSAMVVLRWALNALQGFIQTAPTPNAPLKGIFTNISLPAPEPIRRQQDHGLVCGKQKGRGQVAWGSVSRSPASEPRTRHVKLNVVRPPTTIGRPGDWMPPRPLVLECPMTLIGAMKRVRSNERSVVSSSMYSLHEHRPSTYEEPGAQDGGVSR